MQARVYSYTLPKIISGGKGVGVESEGYYVCAGTGRGVRSLFHFYNEMNFLGVNFPGGVWTPLPRSAHGTYQSFYRILNRNKKKTAQTCIKLDFLIQHQI